jgi:hypothetical protein
MTKRRQQPNAPKPNERDVAEPPAASEQQNSDFFAQVQHLSPADWQSGFKVYVYRTWPVIDKRDEQHYLAKLSEPFDEDVILRNWGSGKYNLRLNNAQGETICSRTVSLHNMAFPPKVSPDEVVQTDPRNERYFKAWPVTAQPAAAQADGAAVHELSKLAARVLEQRDSGTPAGDTQSALTNMLVKWALEQTSKEREGNDPTRIAGLLKELKALLPQQQPADGLAMIERVLTVMDRLNPTRAKPEAEDPLEYLEKFLTVADKLRPPQTTSAMPTEEGGSLASVAVIVHEAAELLKNPLTIAAQVWAASKTRNAGGSAPGATQPPQQRQEPQPSAQPSPAQQEPTPGSSAHPPQSMIVLANAITPVMLKWLHEDAPGSELGASFAGWLCDGWGVEDLKSLQERGAAAIIDLYRQSPVWIVLAPMEAKFQQFVEAFVGWRPTDDTEPDPEDSSRADLAEVD